MSKIKIELNSAGIQELMKSKEIIGYMDELANGVVARCGGAYETNSYVGKTRANVSIITRDRKTYFKNLKDNELLKALY